MGNGEILYAKRKRENHAWPHRCIADPIHHDDATNQANINSRLPSETGKRDINADFLLGTRFLHA